MKLFIVHGPMASGKTRRRDDMTRKFDCNAYADVSNEDTRRIQRKINTLLSTGYDRILVLTTDPKLGDKLAFPAIASVEIEVRSFEHVKGLLDVA